ncbi:MAG TPA: L-serine ammonia-lyase [Bacteroidia bacterium]|nr:L-serine ammonia-lyase [Bacteroidia bacterium]
MESISAFEIIKIGIGPSSSHTMGPWNAADMFLRDLEKQKYLPEVAALKVTLYGSLAKTGLGHGTDVAILMGLSGEDFTKIDTNTIPEKTDKIKAERKIVLKQKYPIPFDYRKDLIFDYTRALPFHANGMSFQARMKNGTEIERKYYSLGGGFVATENENSIRDHAIVTPYPCHHAANIASNCAKLGIGVSDLIYLNEQAWRTKEEIRKQALLLWQEMKECIYRGIHKSGILPGGLHVKRRAFDLNKHLMEGKVYENVDEWISILQKENHDFNKINKWISCFALAVNEENASFGRIVTAPTNGAAGVIPAVLMYAYCFIKDFDGEKIIRFILTAGEIGTLFKKNATISAAMGGCQAEIGVSSAMAAAALTECSNGSPAQVLMASEIAMEHHLGLTCDPIGGLVQIPCIERNTMGAIKAITASNIALESDPAAAKVSLDAVIQTMWDTARDMNTKYKETSEGGLAVAVNITEC